MGEKNEVILRVESISKSFGEMLAVDSVSFGVRREEIFGIAGPNGAGKSTLFNVITRIPFSSDSGQVYLKDERVDGLSPGEICRKGLARTFQIENVFSTLTVLQNVDTAVSYGSTERVHRKQTKRKALEALEFVGLRDEKNRPAGELSLMAKRSLMIATALSMRPKVLLLDEPSAGLTKTEIKDTMELIQKCRREYNISIVLIEHVLPTLLGLSDRVMILNEGRKLTEGLPNDIVANEDVIDVYLGEREVKNDTLP